MATRRQFKPRKAKRLKKDSTEIRVVQTLFSLSANSADEGVRGAEEGALGLKNFGDWFGLRFDPSSYI